MHIRDSMISAAQPVLCWLSYVKDMPKRANLVDNADSHVGGRVKLRRTELGLSQEKLGEAVGVTFQQIQKYEKGTNRIGSSRLQGIAESLGVTPSYFFDGLPEHKPAGNGTPSTAYIKKFVSSEDGKALMRAFQNISRADVRKRIVDLVDSLAKPDR